MRVIAASAHQRVRWKNDGGWTTQLARDPAEGDAFRWRVSIAEIERAGPFSQYPGIDRELLLLDGNGIELDIDGAPPRRLDQRFAGVRFAGEARVECRLLGGPTRDFNVMVDRQSVRSETLGRPLVGSMLIFAAAGTEWLVHVLGGHVAVRHRDTTLALLGGATLHLDCRGATATERVALDGGGELVLVKLTAHDIGKAAPHPTAA